MMLRESFRMSIKAVTANKLRTFLTMLGIIIGVMALVVLVSIVNGASDSVSESINSMGTNSLTVRISDNKDKPLTFSGLNELAGELDSVEAVSVTASGQVTASRQSSSKQGKNTYRNASSGSDSSDDGTETVNVTGTSGTYADIMGLTLTAGNYFNLTDVDNHTYVAVISQDLAEDLVGSRRCVGESIRLSGNTFQIIGVVESGSSSSGMGRRRNSSSYRSYEAYIPFTTLVRLSDSVSPEVTSFAAAAVDEDHIDQAEAELTEAMLARLDQDSDAFSVQNQSQIAETMAEVQNTMAMMLGGIAAISLLVGGIGIMNIMLVSVSERTREIGIRKAIGASRGLIMLQFLIEAILLSLTGCAIGLFGSWGLLKIVGMINETTYHLSVPVAAVSVLFSSLIGIVFGLYPANKAAGRNPIEALRYTG